MCPTYGAYPGEPHLTSDWASILINSNPVLAGLDPLVRRGMELQTQYAFQAADGCVWGSVMLA